MKNDHMENVTENNPNFRAIDGFDRYFVTTEGKVFKTIYKGKKMMEIKPFKGGSNSANAPSGKYEVVGLYRDGVRHAKYVHQLVLNSWVGLRPYSKFQACHTNGNRLDNTVKNLRWDTAKANAADRKRV